MAGLLGDGWDDPQSMATLSLAAGLLGPGGFGVGLGRGLQGYQASMANAADLQAKRQALQMNQLQFQAAMRNQNIINDLLSRYQGGGAAQPEGPSSATTALAQGAQQPALSDNPLVPQRMDVGPTTGNAQRMDAMPRPQVSAQPEDPFGAIPGNAAMWDLAFNQGKGIPNLIMESKKPTSLRPGGYASYADGRMEQLPQVPEGSTAVRGQDGRWHIVPVEGGQSAVASSAAAKASGAAGYKQTEVLGPDNQRYTVFNRDLPGFDSQTARAPAPSAPNRYQIPPSEQAARDSDRVTILRQELDRINARPAGDPNAASDRRAVQNELLRLGVSASAPAPSGTPPNAVRTGLAPGVAEAAKNGQDTMNESFKAVRAANQSSQTVQARLDGIEALSQKAITGGDTEWRDFANNLLSIAGVSDKATDRKTAGDLIEKYNSQIALALGTGSQGTDALRAMASAANPNRKMTPDAMAEAAQQLRAAAQAQQVKAQLLTPLFNGGDYKSYNDIEQKFDKNADYRLWHIRSATQGMNPQQAQAYLQAHFTPAQLAMFKQQRAALKEIGVNP